MSSRAEPLPKRLVVGVLLMTLVVLGLGGAIVVVKLRPAELPTTAIDRNLEQWERAVLANPKDEEARIGLGLALLDAGRLGEARTAFEDALELNPDSWMAMFQIGLLDAEEEPDGALELLARAASAAPPGNKAVVLIAQGDLLFAQGDPEGARAAYEASIADTPFIIDSHLGLARALEALGDEKGALKQYREAARFDPGNQAIADAIARLKGND